MSKNAFTIYPGSVLKGEVVLPGDKSISHRAILFSCLAKGTCRITNPLKAGVTEVMLKALSDLGVLWQWEDQSLVIEGRGWKNLTPPRKPVNCGHSATTMRLLAGLAAAADLPLVLDGSAALRSRPMGRVVKPLQLMGVPIKSSPEGRAPLVIISRVVKGPLRGMQYRLPVPSAQLKTALLLAGLDADGALVLEEPGPSRDHSERLLQMMGCPITVQPELNKITIDPPEKPHLDPFEMAVPGDFSSAAFLIIAALVTPGSDIILRDVGVNPTRLGLLDALSSMGSEIEITNMRMFGPEPAADLRVRAASLRGIDLAGELPQRMMDEFPVFTVAACRAEGRTVVSDARELRHKESDRIRVVVEELRRHGVEIEEKQDGYTLRGPQKIDGGVFDPHQDHRLAMAFTIAGLTASQPVTVQKAHLIQQSFPNFLTTLRDLGARVT